MSATAPTRQTLRHLRRLCTGEPVSSASPSPLACLRAGPRREGRAWAIPAAAEGIFSGYAIQSRRLLSATRCVNQEARSGHQHNHNHNRHSTEHKDASGTGATNGPDSGSTTTTTTPDITNYYTLFPRTLPSGPPPQGPFDIPAAQLKREFLQLQAQHHPDKHNHGEHQHQHSSAAAAAAAAQHQSARALSSLLNTAYKTLSDPLLRARYLLHHNYGVDITAEDNNTHRGLSDQDTLMEVLEAQEAIEDATTQDQIDALKDENDARIAQTVELLGRAFESDDINLAKRECIRLNYWRSLQQGLHDWEPGKEVRLIH